MSNVESPTIEDENIPMSLSEEWAELSAQLCGPEFIQSLGHFFVEHHVHTILECACGDGYVLRAISNNKGIKGIGIDSDEYLISKAQNSLHNPAVSFKRLNIVDIDKDPDIGQQPFDAVMIRGNGITSLGAWGTTKETFNAAVCEKIIQEALVKMWKRLKNGGILYLDVTRQEDIDKGNHSLKIDSGGVHITGEITIDHEHKRRDAFGHGTVNGRPFSGGSSSYLIEPRELKKLIKELLQPKKIWTPAEIKDAMYEVICAQR